MQDSTREPPVPPADPPSAAAPKVVPLFDGTTLLERLERRMEELQPAYRPIVRLRGGGVLGWEVLSALPGGAPASPSEWSDRGRLRFAEAVEARLLEVALRSRAELPGGALLFVTISGRALVSAPVRQALAAAGRALDGVVITVADSFEPQEPFAIVAALEDARAAGVRVAVEDGAPSYLSLRRILRLQPAVVRAGAALVEELDRDAARAVAVQMLVAVARRIGAQVALDGISRPEELEAACSLGADCVQGPLVGHPAPAMVAIPSVVAEALARPVPARDPAERTGHPREVRLTLAHLVEEATVMAADAPLADLADAFLMAPESDYFVLIDADDRPVGMADRAALLRGEPFEHRVLTASPSDDVRSVARRAVARPPLERYSPVVCLDDRGRCTGIVRFERLVESLAR